MKKLVFAMIGGTMLLAGPSNYVGLSDVKDALYYLIQDYNTLLKKNEKNKNYIIKVEKKMNKEIDTINTVIKKRDIKVDNELNELLNKVKSLKKRALLVKEEDKYDKSISDYVKENEDFLKKTK